MRLYNVILWLVSALLAVYNVLTNEDNGMWIVIAVLFSANAVRQTMLYLKEKKEKDHG